MSSLSFSVAGARVEQYAATPSLVLRLRVADASGQRIHAIALRTQVRIEPQRRRYGTGESDRLLDLFGPRARYGDTLRALLWTHSAQTVVGFDGETEFELHVPCSYDFEVSAHKYLSALEDGEIPLTLQFSGSVFVQSERGVEAELVPWTCEATYALPVAMWRQAVDAVFPNSAWIRIDRSTFDELCRLKAARMLPTWDAVLLELCDRAAARNGAHR